MLRSKLKITKIEDYKIFHNCNSTTKHSYNTVQRTQIATAIRHFWLTKHTLRVERGFCLRRLRGLQQTVTCSGKSQACQICGKVLHSRNGRGITCDLHVWVFRVPVTRATADLSYFHNHQTTTDSSLNVSHERLLPTCASANFPASRAVMWHGLWHCDQFNCNVATCKDWRYFTQKIGAWRKRLVKK